MRRPDASSHEHDAGGEDVGARVDGLAARVLRAHVAGLALDGLVQLVRRRAARRGDERRSRVRDAEVADLHLALERHEQVRRRHVAVHDAERPPLVVGAPVRVVEPAQRLAHDVDAELEGQRHLARASTAAGGR